MVIKRKREKLESTGWRVVFQIRISHGKPWLSDARRAATRWTRHEGREEEEVALGSFQPIMFSLKIIGHPFHQVSSWVVTETSTLPRTLESVDTPGPYEILCWSPWSPWR